jgi:formylglycine-generating enzyme required for sulfatase activity
MSLHLREACKNKWMWIVIGTLVCATLTAGLIYRHDRAQLAQASQLAGAYCDNGIGAAKAQTVTRAIPAAPTARIAQTAWTPKINDSKPREPAPAGMVWIPGGQFWMGNDDAHMPDSKPWHRVYVDGYWMDRTEVTNEQFAS